MSMVMHETFCWMFVKPPSSDNMLKDSL